MKKMRNEKGFTLIEIVMVIVLLGILAAVAIPRFIDLSTEALTSSKAGMSGAVKGALGIEIAKKAATGTAPIYPTVTELAAAITPAGTAVATGVQVAISGTNYIAPTYTDSACTAATAAVGDLVQCVGDIP